MTKHGISKRRIIGFGSNSKREKGETLNNANAETLEKNSGATWALTQQRADVITHLGTMLVQSYVHLAPALFKPSRR